MSEFDFTPQFSVSTLPFDVQFTENSMSFETEFKDALSVYVGVSSVWIGDGTNGDNGVLYAKMADDATQRVGPVSGYYYALQSGFTGTFSQWVQTILDGSSNAEAAATSAEEALASQAAAAESETNAAESARNAAASESTVSGYVSSALEYKNQAATSASNSASSAAEASSSASAASQSANTASSAQSAAVSAKNAAESASASATSAKNAAQTSASNAASSATSASSSASTANQSREDSEAWAVGKRNGVNVGTTDPTYHNNSKYYSDIASAMAAEVRSPVLTFAYQNSTSGTVVPTGTWGNPDPQNGLFMWERTTITWGSGNTSYMYSVSYIGENGTGSVDSVNGMGGDVILDGKNIYIDNSVSNKETIYAAFSRVGTPITNAQIDALFS